MDRAERAASHAGSPTAARDAVKDARRALDVARRLPGRGRERAELLRDLERKLEKVERAADRADAAARDAEQRSRSIAAEPDPLSRQAIGVPPAPPASSLHAELELLRSGQGSNLQVGEFAEAVAAGLAVLVQGHEILHQHHPEGSPHGLDIQTLDRDGKIWTYEVKGTRVPGKRPSTAAYPAGRQGSPGYVFDRSQSAHAIAPGADAVGGDADQMGTLLVTVNLPDDVVTVWELDETGKRSGTPLETYALGDVVQHIDDNNRP